MSEIPEAKPEKTLTAFVETQKDEADEKGSEINSAQIYQDELNFLMLRHGEENLKEISHNRRLRWGCFVMLTMLGAFWVFSVFVVMALSGERTEVLGMVLGIKHSNTVLITYLTTTTGSVFGLITIAVKWLFNPGEAKARRKLWENIRR
jgi:hypothetical protein